MLRFHHHYHLSAFVKLSLVGCLLRQWMFLFKVVRLLSNVIGQEVQVLNKHFIHFINRLWSFIVA